MCGDGLQQEGVEECDQGNENADSSSCTTLCTVAACGDGFVWDGFEDCDDMNDAAGDFCDACAFEAITYEFDGAPVEVDLPDWVTAVQITADGAQGGGFVGNSYHIGGGGGGYYGGGGAYAAGGGGGSSYLGDLGDAETMPGVQAGDGQVVIVPVAM